MFDLRFISESIWSDERNELVVRGRIILGQFSEMFESSLSYWAQTNYEQQWLAAAKRIDKGEAESAFIVDMYDPSKATFIVWWPVWRIGQGIRVQNQLLFLARLNGGFDATTPYVHIKGRKTESDEGGAISEWQVGKKDIEDFIARYNTKDI